MNIVLMGYRGTGKSVIGRILARRLQRPLYSIDRMITEEQGRSIAEIVEQEGWPRFRELEAAMVERVAGQDGCIIDCGGGVVLDPRNVERLKQNGKVILLEADFDVILHRLRHGRGRPPLKDGVSFEEEQKRVLDERKDRYSAAADLVFDTSYITPAQSVQNIIDQLRKRGWI